MKQFEIHLGCFYKHNGNACYVSSIHDEAISIKYTKGKSTVVFAEDLDPLELNLEYLKKISEINDFVGVIVKRIIGNEVERFLFQHVNKDCCHDYLCYIKYMHEFQLHVMLSCGVSITESIISFYNKQRK